MEESSIEDIKVTNLAYQAAAAFLATMNIGTSMDPKSDRGRVLAKVDQGSAFAAGGLLFMGVLGAIGSGWNDASGSPRETLGDLFSATMIDPMDTVTGIARFAPPLVLIGVGLILFGVQCWTLAIQFTKKKVEDRYKDDLKDPAWLPSTVEPLRQAIQRYAWLRPVLMALNAAGFAIIAWLLASASGIPGWVSVLLIWFGHMGVSSLINRYCVKGVLEPSLKSVQSELFKRVHWALVNP